MERSDFLAELCVEDLPVNIQDEASQRLLLAVAEFYAKEKISFSLMRSFSTPRRLAVLFCGVAREIPEEKTLIKGPPARISFDGKDEPTEVLNGFLKKFAADIADIRLKTTDKGDYVFLETRKPQRKTEEVIRNNIAGILETLKFGKTMRWDKYSFPRPVRNVLILFGGKPLKVSCFGINSSKGSRSFFNEVIMVKRPSMYEKTLERKGIIADRDKRRGAIAAGLVRAEKILKAKVVPDDDLLAETAGICERPCVFPAEFDKKFLSMPPEILEETLKIHQKCFSLTSLKTPREVINKFIFVTDGVNSNIPEITANYERCVEARFEDSKFFWESDKKRKLPDFYQELKNIANVGKFGNLGDKAERVVRDAGKIASVYAPSGQEQVKSVSKLLYCDFPTKTVFEFPLLHGIAASYLALAQNLPGAQDVRNAATLEEISDISAVCGLADRLNTLKSFFYSGVAVTTSSDPYGLKKTADEICKIFVTAGIYFDLNRVFSIVFDDVSDDIRKKVASFLRARFVIFLTKKGIARDEIDMATEKFEVPKRCFDIAAAVGLLRKKEAVLFEKIIIASKRAENILKQAEKLERKMSVLDDKLLDACEEVNLFQALKKVEATVLAACGKNDFEGALNCLSEIKAPLDSFFDGVLVMDKDEKIRDNRLALVKRILDLFSIFGKFSNIVLKDN